MKSPHPAKSREYLQSLWRIADFYDKRQLAFRILKKYYRSGQILAPHGKIPLGDFLRSQNAAWTKRNQSGVPNSISLLEECLGLGNPFAGRGNEFGATAGSGSQMKSARSRKPIQPVDYLAMARRCEWGRSEQSRWLTEVADRLATCRTFKCREVQYWNHPDLPEDLRVQGYYVCYQASDHYGFPLYVMISRSHTSKCIELEQIIRELRSSDIVFPFDGFGEYYAKRSAKRGPGTYSTIHFGIRWYMISVCGTLTPFHKLIKGARPVVKPLDIGLTDQQGRSTGDRLKGG